MEKNAFADKRVLIEEYDKLIRLQSAIEIDRRKWPGVILDTAAWTKWTIWGASTSAEMQEIVSTFDMALVSGDLTSEEQERIRGRRDIVLNNQRNK